MKPLTFVIRLARWITFIALGTAITGTAAAAALDLSAIMRDQLGAIVLPAGVVGSLALTVWVLIAQLRAIAPRTRRVDAARRRQALRAAVFTGRMGS